jgi:hypothetical protein
MLAIQQAEAAGFAHFAAALRTMFAEEFGSKEGAR